MKKLTALILSALTAFAATALCACGDGKSAGENDGKNNAVTPATVLKPGDDGYTPAVPDEITLTEIPEDKMAETFDNFCDKVYRYNNGAVKSENLNATIDYICEYYDNYDFVIFPNFATEESCQKTVELYNFQLLNEDGKKLRQTASSFKKQLQTRERSGIYYATLR